jgi:hypothetical protein
MFIQKQPDQIIWCIKDDGEVALLAYERSQEVVGWSRFVTDGDVISGCALPASDNEDDVWLVIKRGDNYCIERAYDRSESVYTDSTTTVTNTAVAASVKTDLATDDYLFINKVGHNLSNGDVVYIENSGLDYLDGKNFTVTVKDPDNFNITLIGTSEKVHVKSFIVDGATNTDINGTYDYSFGNGKSDDATTLYEKSDGWEFAGWYLSGPSMNISSPFGYDPAVLIFNSSPVITDFPWNYTWTTFPEVTAITFAGYPATQSLNYTQVINEVTIPVHANKTLQAVSENGYVGEFTADGTGLISLGTLDYYSSIVIGLGYDSIMRTMPIEPTLGNRLPQSRVKGIVKLIIKFYKTIGASAGEYGRLITSSPTFSTFDETDRPIDARSGDLVVNIGSDWRREKIIEVKQDLPYPMTVLSLSAWTEVKGG